MGTYLFRRVLQEGKDSRFDKIKESPPLFFAVWAAQATWVSLCLMPVIAINSVPASAFVAMRGDRITDILGIALYVGGFGLEAMADWQKSQWMHERRAKVHDEEFMTRGLWRRW